mmetsp:Transcript_39755/g.78622  ORF Transcript_39755/g.78622 Transcript_39755/m.78622 type:complete len:158 (+) Transcript_39755:159-632(+)
MAVLHSAHSARCNLPCTFEEGPVPELLMLLLLLLLLLLPRLLLDQASSPWDATVVLLSAEVSSLRRPHVSPLAPPAAWSGDKGGATGTAEPPRGPEAVAAGGTTKEVERRGTALFRTAPRVEDTDLVAVALLPHRDGPAGAANVKLPTPEPERECAG